jgi:hypothetical protein
MAMGPGRGGRINETDAVLLFSLALLIAASLMAIFHKPWWKFYLVHFHIPMALMAGLGTAWLLRRSFQHIDLNQIFGFASNASGKASLRPKLRHPAPIAALASAGIVSLWCGFTLPSFFKDLSLVYQPPKASDSELCRVMKTYSDRARWVFTISGAYAFHGGVIIPPELVVVSQKRVWSNQISDKEMFAIARKYDPEVLLLEKRDQLRTEMWLDWIKENYLPVAQDELKELWIHQRLEPQRIESQDHRLASFEL